MLSQELSQEGVSTHGNTPRRPPAKAKADPSTPSKGHPGFHAGETFALPKATRAAAAFKRFSTWFARPNCLAAPMLPSRNRAFIGTVRLSGLRLALCILACLGGAPLASAQCSLTGVTIPSGWNGYVDQAPPNGDGDFFTNPGGGSTTLNLEFNQSGCAWQMEVVQYSPPQYSPPLPLMNLVTLSEGTQTGTSVSGTASTTSVAVTLNVAPNNGPSGATYHTNIYVDGVPYVLPGHTNTLSIFDNTSQCTASLSPTSAFVPYSGGPVTFNLTTGAGVNCWSWPLQPLQTGITAISYTYDDSLAGGTSTNPYMYLSNVAPNLTDAPRTLTITFTEPAPATFTIYQAGSMTFTSVNGAVPPPQSLPVTGVGSFTASPTSTGNWLSVLPTSGTLPATLSISVNPAGLAAGSRLLGYITLNTPGTSSSPQYVPVVLDVVNMTTACPAPTALLGAPYSQTLPGTVSTLTPPPSVSPTTYNWTVTPALPPGLTLSGAVISGQPLASDAGTYPFTLAFGATLPQITFAAVPINAPVSSGPTTVYTMLPCSIYVPPPMAITSSCPLPPATVGQGYNQFLAATGGSTPYTWSLANGALPGGLQLTGAGDIFGLPSAAGTFGLTLQVQDATGLAVTEGCSLTVDYPPLTLGACPKSTGEVGAPYSSALNASGGDGPYTFTVASGALPPNLKITGNYLTGTPNTAGAYPFMLAVSSLAGSTPPESCSINIKANPLAISGFCQQGSMPAATIGVNYSLSPSVSGGTGPYTWKAIGLPLGLTINASTGTISGQATIPSIAGSYPVTLQVTDSGGNTLVANCTITLAPPVLSLAPKCPTTGVAGQPYSFMLQASGGTPPYTWAVSGLPSDLIPNKNNGIISGTPSIADVGPHLLTIQVTDAQGNVATQTPSCSLMIASSAPAIITACPLPPGRVGGVYPPLTLTANNGTMPYTWSVSGNLDGLALSGNTISGKPSVAGNALFTLEVTDSNSLVATEACGININPAPSITGLSQSSTTAGTSSLTLTVTGTGFDTQSTVLWNGTSLQTTYVNATELTAMVGSTLLATPGNATITIGEPGGSGSTGPLFSVVLPPDPTVTLTVVPGAADAPCDLPQAQQQFCPTAPAQSPLGGPQIVVSSSGYPLDLYGIAILTVTPETGSSDPTVNQAETSVQFVESCPAQQAPGSPCAAVPACAAAPQSCGVFKINANTTSTNSTPQPMQLALQTTGTVASSISLQIVSLQAYAAGTAPDLSAGGAPPNSPALKTLAPPTTSPPPLQVPQLAPVITAAYYCTTSSGWQVQIVGYSTIRSLSGATVTFQVGGTTLTTSVGQPLMQAAVTWFTATSSYNWGGNFEATIPYSGNVPSIDAATVQVSNSMGSSPPVQATSGCEP